MNVFVLTGHVKEISPDSMKIEKKVYKKILLHTNKVDLEILIPNTFIDSNISIYDYIGVKGKIESTTKLIVEKVSILTTNK